MRYEKRKGALTRRAVEVGGSYIYIYLIKHTTRLRLWHLSRTQALTGVIAPALASLGAGGARYSEHLLCSSQVLVYLGTMSTPHVVPCLCTGILYEEQI